MSSTEKATAASGSPAAAVAVVACSRERPRPRLETMPIRHLRSIRRTSTFEKSHDRGQEQGLALRSSRPSFMKRGSVRPRTHTVVQIKSAISFANRLPFVVTFADPLVII